MKHSITALVWDLSGTIFKADPSRLSLKERKACALMLYLWGGRKTKSPTLQKALTLLNTLGVQKGSPQELVRVSHGELVPQIVCDWLTGRISSAVATERALSVYSYALQKHAFKSVPEQSQVKNLLQHTFDTDALARSMKAVPQIMACIARCAKNKKITQYILSNWDPESLIVLSELTEGQKALRYFNPNNIVTSGNSGLIKPHYAIYRYFLAKYSLDPARCLFIDNQEENLVIGRTLGMKTFYLRKNYRKLEKLLIQYQVY